MTKAINDLSPEYIRSILDYNPNTGALTWKPRVGNDRGTNAFNAKHAGKKAGYINRTTGYRLVRITNPVTGKTRLYMAHRLAYAITKNAWPTNLIDHEDKNKDNNRWPNLIPATPSENMRRQSLYKNNRSGYKGVSWSKEKRKWVARATNPRTGNRVLLGKFTDKIEAATAYDSYAEKHYGIFAELNFPK